MFVPPVVIIFEPDPMISGVLRVEFSHWDYAVLLADSADEAHDYALQTTASLVVLDASKVRMPAFEACARIRRHEGYAGRPIVLSVREISGRLQAAAEAAGATALLLKPYSMMDLFRAVTPHIPPDDPLLQAGRALPGAAEPPMQEWSPPPSLEWRSGGESALSRNKLLLPIVRSNIKPLMGKTS